MALTKSQTEAWAALSPTEPRCAYTLGIGLTTLNALVRKGYAKDVTKPGPGSMFSPRTHFHFVRANPFKGKTA